MLADSACSLFGANAFTIQDVEKLLTVSYTNAQKSELKEIQLDISRAALNKNDYILFPGFPLTVLQMRKRFPELFLDRDAISWYDASDWATRQSVGLSWYLMRRHPLPSASFQEVSVESKEILKLPAACEIIYGAALLLLGQKRCPFSSSVWCLEQDPWESGFHIAVHIDQQSRFVIRSYADQSRLNFLPFLRTD